MTTLLGELRQAVRLLRNQPAFAVTAVSTLALAIAANTMMFGIIRAVLLDPLPVPGPDRLVRIEQVHHAGASNVTGATFVDVRARSAAFSDIAAFRVAPATFSAASRQRAAGPGAVQAAATTMTAGYFPVLAIHPIAGRAPSPQDFQAGAPAVAFISASLWARVFDRNPDAVGRLVSVNASSRAIAGIFDVPASIPGAADLWLPYPDDAELLRNRRARLFTVLGRLRPDVTAASATAELDGLARTIRSEAPEAGADLSLRATPLAERLAQPVRSSLLLLWTAVAVLLLIALTNVANLLLMQGSIRARELSLRTALGASRAALTRQLAVECGVLGLAGGALGSAVGCWGLQAARAILPPSLPRIAEIRADAWLAGLGILVSIAAAVACGIGPALRASRRDAAAALRTREGAGSGSRMRDALVAAEVALTVTLLFGAGLLGRSLLRISEVPLGFDPDGVVTADLSLPLARYPDAAAHARFYARLLEEAANVPGIAAAGATGALPLSPTAATTMIPQDGRDDQSAAADVITVTPGALRALRIPILRGRALSDDDRTGTAPVVLVNETAARQFWPAGVDPIGRTIEMRDWGAPYRATVVGIAGDVRQAAPYDPVAPAVLYPLGQFPETTMTETLVVRSGAPIDRVMAAIRAAVARVDAEQPIALAAAMPDRLAASLAGRRLDLQMLGGFAAAALLLAGVGIYGLVAFAIAARTREIGVRIALGASPAQIARLVVSRGSTPVLIGTVLGAVASLTGARAIEDLVFGVPARDPATLLAAIALILIATIAALAAPARLALRIDPVVALRAE